MDAKSQFIRQFGESLAAGSFVKLTLSKPDRAEERKNIFLRPVLIREAPMVAFTHRYPQRDEVKNHSWEEAAAELEASLGNDFLKADLFTLEQDVSLLYNKKRKSRLFTQAATHSELPSRQHDRQKNRLLEADGQVYLREMGITDQSGKVVKSGQKKYRQINKYIEIIDNLLEQHPISGQPHVVDMGSGKGYLTFALYDYLTRVKNWKARLTGIELRPKLVQFGNQLAQKTGFDDLEFISQDINDYDPERIDMLIALHACDIATDLAIAKGIHAGAEIIVVAPCCHKQIRKQMNCQTDMQAILRHGILEERQAELVTDGIRSLLLEYSGYRTRVFEFIDTEHTPKNLLIVGTKASPDPEALDRVQAIKKDFGITYHYLEKLLGIA
ncbi:class I SAM-dependent methyltransferase [Flavilitoribacter nigricans]|uniref:SAM-dependent methyltransferase n=1 Tax=Flavilitoribacter nigricans (strain ATCC 23147 / DSM 23189 / NBRC 102662 / NCIMB 1420 / SS-2) TaxID=1122177 RepID=A0A2D0MZR1_FLAN2|nr:SAM-dependent methyltransferase [Flavilitoribacter nigricans]PHN01735.1 SAM-dependent methyltransferase [Flavilitoribacter nigricans DSM 23189 = NBRC 102662]